MSKFLLQKKYWKQSHYQCIAGDDKEIHDLPRVIVTVEGSGGGGGTGSGGLGPMLGWWWADSQGNFNRGGGGEAGPRNIFAEPPTDDAIVATIPFSNEVPERDTNFFEEERRRHPDRVFFEIPRK